MKKCFLLLILMVSAVLFSGTLKSKIIYSFVKGNYWYHDMKVGIIKIKSSPQIALWTETTDGKFIETVYISKTAVKWIKKENADRLDVLPVWQSKEKGSVDAVSGATVADKGSLHREIKSENNKIVFFAEINNSFDYNDYYTEKAGNYSIKTGVNGQPSLIYSVEADLTNKKQYNLTLIGHGSIGKKSEVIEKDMDKITTAKDIVKSIIVAIE